MNDQLGLFDRPGDDETGELNLTELRAALVKTAGAPTPPDGKAAARRQQRAARAAAVKRRRRRTPHTVIAVIVLVVIAAAVVVGFKVWRKDTTAIPDFTGSGESETVVRVQSGDSLTDIADTLAGDLVVASADSFINAAADNSDVKKIKTGYYKVRLHSSASAAVAAITNPTARVGQLRLIPGRQLADVRAGSSGAITEGYITTITKAACVPLNGVSSCFTPGQLWQAEETADPSTLGVVAWAISAVAKAPDPKKRLEGMLVPGDYDVPPGSSASQVLQELMSASAANWNATDIVADAKALNRTPYDVAVIASLAEREGTTANMSKVTRVIYNRLQQKMKLQLDSTVDYSLGHSQIATTAAERANPSPYNTYSAAGLPPTPITSPGATALAAALEPDDGNWLFFVQVDKQRNFCFSATFAEHNKCVAQARANGVFGDDIGVMHRTAVLGSPVAHSLSPALHRAGFLAAGLDGWTYDRIECDDVQLPRLVTDSGPEWVGFSVTMPGKAAAAAVAEVRSHRVDELGVANTLWRGPRGWYAENSDVDGVIGALGSARVAPHRVLLLGGGGTARSVVAALAELGVTSVVLAGRRPQSTADCVELARRLGLDVSVCDLSVPGIAAHRADVDLVVSTLPAGVADHLAGTLASVPVLFDAVYHPWPTRLAAVSGTGRITVTGLDMLLHQAFRQFELFTGQPAPKAAMRAGLLEASGARLPLPIG